MDFGIVKKGPWYNLTATMEIRDASGTLAPDGVMITGAIFRDEAPPFNRNVATKGGVAVWKLKTQNTGIWYTIKVTGADDGAGSAFSANANSCKRIKIHNDANFTEDICQ